MKIHIVKKGDTLNELAKKYQSTLDQIIAFNPQIANPDHLDIGMKVKIPSKPKPVDPPASEYVYKHVVQQGDSLWKLGKAWDVPLQAMIGANPQLKNPNVLMTGEIVYVPKMDHGEVEIQPPSMSKPSTQPFPPVPAVQPWEPVDLQLPSYMPIVEAPMSEQSPSQAGATITIAEPSVSAPMTSTPVLPAPEPGVIGLGDPYDQPAVHPFQQFHISATEVFAYPGSEQQEASTYPAFSPYQQAPWEQFPYAGEPAPYTMSDEGCGCGSPSMNEQPWTTFPAGYPTGPIGNPWDGYQQSLPAFPGMYPPGSPYDNQLAAHNPYAYQMNPYEIPYAGAHYQAPYESHIFPQVHTHELAKETDTEEVIEVDIRSDTKANQPRSSSSKKARLSGASALNDFLKRQQRASEKLDSKPNTPWINF